MLTGLSEDTIPEIQRCPLSSVALQLLALGVKNILTFDFMSPPPEDSLLRAVEELYLLGAVEKEDRKKENITTLMDNNNRENKKREEERKKEEEEDYSLQLTPLGEKLSCFPLEPILARAIVSSEAADCSHEMLSVVAMLSVDSVIFSPHNKKEEVAAAHKKFLSCDGDHVTLLNIYRGYKHVKGNKVFVYCLLFFVHVFCLFFFIVVFVYYTLEGTKAFIP